MISQSLLILSAMVIFLFSYVQLNPLDKLFVYYVNNILTEYLWSYDASWDKRIVFAT